MTSARTAHSHVAQLRRLESAKQKRTHAPNPRVTKPCVSKACMSKPCVSNAHMNKPCVSKGMSGQVLCGPCMNGQARSFQQDTHSYSTARAPSFTQSARPNHLGHLARLSWHIEKTCHKFTSHASLKRDITKLQNSRLPRTQQAAHLCSQPCKVRAHPLIKN